MVSRPVPTWNLVHELYNSIYSGERGVRMKVIEMGLHWDCWALQIKKDEVQIKVWETQAIAQNDEEYAGSIRQVESEYNVESIDNEYVLITWKTWGSLDFHQKEDKKEQLQNLIPHRMGLLSS